MTDVFITFISVSTLYTHTPSHMMYSPKNYKHNTQGEAVEQNKRSPSDFLKAVLGRPVNVRLNSGTDYRGESTYRWLIFVIMRWHSIYLMIAWYYHILSGVLACLDGYMNIAMEQTEEYVDGQLKSKYGDCFIRGNNGMLLVNLLVVFLIILYLYLTAPYSPSLPLFDTPMQCFTSRVRRDS